MSTSKLQQYVNNQLCELNISFKENTRPDWLITPEGERLELDFYIEEIDIAIEVQGKQHYIFVPHFHGNYDGYKRTIRRDNFKVDVCDRAGIDLIEVSNETEADECIKRVKSIIELNEILAEVNTTTNIDNSYLNYQITAREVINPMYQQLEIIGNVGSDPILNTTPSGQTVCNLTVCTKKITGKNNEEMPIWFKVSVWGNQAKMVADIIKKGDLIFCKGQLSKPALDARDSSYPMNAQEVKFLRFSRRREDEVTVIGEDIIQNAS